MTQQPCEKPSEFAVSMQWDKLFLSNEHHSLLLDTLAAGDDENPVSDSDAGMESDDSEMAEVVSASESAESSTDYDSEAEHKQGSDSDEY